MRLSLGGKEMSIIKRPSIVYIECPAPECRRVKRSIAVAPVFGEHGGTRYEAWAQLWFKEGETGRGRCQVIYTSPGRPGIYERPAGSGQLEELVLPESETRGAPSTVATKIVGYQVNGWVWWRHESERGVITLDELACNL